MQNMVSNNNALNQKSKTGKKIEKLSNIQNLNNTFLKDHGSKQKSQKMLKNILNQMKVKTKMLCKWSKDQSISYCLKRLYQKRKKDLNNLSFHIKKLEKRKKLIQDKQKKRNNKYQGEVLYDSIFKKCPNKANLYRQKVDY